MILFLHLVHTIYASWLFLPRDFFSQVDTGFCQTNKKMDRWLTKKLDCWPWQSLICCCVKTTFHRANLITLLVLSCASWKHLLSVAGVLLRTMQCYFLINLLLVRVIKLINKNKICLSLKKLRIGCQYTWSYHMQCIAISVEYLMSQTNS